MGAPRINKCSRAGRIYDPVFLCMVGAMVLAVASSVTLRAVMAHTGELQKPSAAEPGELDWHEDGPIIPAPPYPHRPAAVQYQTGAQGATR